MSLIPIEISKRLKVKAVSFSVDQEIRRLIANFSALSIPAEIPSSLYLDATRYDLPKIHP